VRRYAVVHPLAGQAARSWPAERFSAIADELVTSYGLTVCLIGTPGERPGLEGLRERMQRPDRVLIVTEPLPVTLALLANMVLFVGNMSGPAQLAGLVSDAPVVSVSGPTDKVKWQPLRQGELAILLSGPVCPGRCRKAKCRDEWRCILDVPVDAVSAAIRTVLSAGPLRSKQD
jgi:ADP-heptose:LPS heptosyltransferase